MQPDPSQRIGCFPRSLARELLAAAPGAPLPPIRSLAERFGASIGAAQRALAGLAADGAVRLDR